MRYLNLSILLLVVVLGFEYFFRELALFGITTVTMMVLDTTLVVASGAFMIAFLASLKKMKAEQRHILYLVVLAVVALKALAIMRI